MSHNDGVSRKISEFLKQNAIQDNALITFVQNGANVTMTVADFLNSRSLAGALSQIGAPTGTPILKQTGATDEIRNLEAGPGIATSVSAQDGATISQNFIQGLTGTPVLADPTTSPIIRSIVAGVGVTVSTPDNTTIQIAAPGVVTASSVVIINQMSDFPSAVSGVRTLANDTEYLVSANLTTSDRFVMGNNTVLNGSNSRTNGITFTGTATHITAVDAQSEFSRLTVIATSGKLLDITSTTGAHQFLMASINATQVDDLGTFGGLELFQVLQCSFDNITTQGFVATGNNGVILMERFIADVNGGTFLDLGTSTTSALILTTFLADLASGTTFLSGLASSGNINVGGLGSMFTGRFSGVGTILNNITTDDALWQFLLNDDIADTRPDGLLSMQANATPTVIAVTGTPVLIAGTWVVKRTSQMTGTAAGRLTYNGGKNATMPITASVTAEPVSGASQILSACVAINGVVDPDSVRPSSASPGNPASITVPWQENLSTTDFVEIFVANESTTNNILVSSVIHRVN